MNTKGGGKGGDILEETTRVNTRLGKSQVGGPDVGVIGMMMHGMTHPQTHTHVHTYAHIHIGQRCRW